MNHERLSLCERTFINVVGQIALSEPAGMQVTRYFFYHVPALKKQGEDKRTIPSTAQMVDVFRAAVDDIDWLLDGPLEDVCDVYWCITKSITDTMTAQVTKRIGQEAQNASEDQA